MFPHFTMSYPRHSKGKKKTKNKTTKPSHSSFLCCLSDLDVCRASSLTFSLTPAQCFCPPLDPLPQQWRPCPVRGRLWDRPCPPRGSPGSPQSPRSTWTRTHNILKIQFLKNTSYSTAFDNHINVILQADVSHFCTPGYTI